MIIDADNVKESSDLFAVNDVNVDILKGKHMYSIPIKQNFDSNWVWEVGITRIFLSLFDLKNLPLIKLVQFDYIRQANYTFLFQDKH